MVLENDTLRGYFFLVFLLVYLNKEHSASKEVSILLAQVALKRGENKSNHAFYALNVALCVCIVRFFAHTIAHQGCGTEKLVFFT